MAELVAEVIPPAPLPAMARVQLARSRTADDLLALALRSRNDTVLAALTDAAALHRGPTSLLPRMVEGQQLPDRALRRGETLPHTLALATAWAGMARSTAEQQAAVEIFRQVLERVGPAGLTPRDQRSYLQVAYLVGRHDLVEEGLRSLPRVTPAVVAGLRADLANPFVGGPRATGHQEWEALFGSRFVEKGLTPPRIDPGPVPFDGLTLERPGTVDGPLVSVVVPAYRPDAGLLTSVRSILAQTHAHLEVLLVDDCSGPEFADLFEKATSLDERVRLLRPETNGGSYLARNLALGRARGEFVTTQDADDWSHTERIARQVELLRADPHAAGSRSAAIRALPDLTRQWFGYSPERMNASALMVRRDLLERLGGFDPIRKGADSEMHERLGHLGGVVDLHEPLAITRLAAGSLSRADFSYGRHSPERVLFRSAFRHWHRTAGEDLGRRVEREGSFPYAVPRAFTRALPHAAPAADAYRLVLLVDQHDPLPAGADEALAALLRPGGTGDVAVLGRENLLRAGSEVLGWDAGLLEAAVDGLPLLTDNDADVHAGTLLVLDPDLLALPALPMPGLTADRVVVVAVPGADLETVGAVVRDTWGCPPTWVAADGHARDEWAQDGWTLPVLTELVTS